MFIAFAAKDNMYLCFVIPKATANQKLHSNILSKQSSMNNSLYRPISIFNCNPLPVQSHFSLPSEFFCL